MRKPGSRQFARSSPARHPGTSVFALRGQADRISVFSRQSRPRAVNGLEDGFFFLALLGSSTFSADTSLARATRIMFDSTLSIRWPCSRSVSQVLVPVTKDCSARLRTFSLCLGVVL